CRSDVWKGFAFPEGCPTTSAAAPPPLLSGECTIHYSALHQCPEPIELRETLPLSTLHRCRKIDSQYLERTPSRPSPVKPSMRLDALADSSSLPMPSCPTICI